MIYGPVVYQKRDGTLTAQEDHIVFEETNNNHKGAPQKWAWTHLEKVSTNAAGAAKALLRVNQTNGKKLFFLFPDREVLESTKEDIKARVINALMMQDNNVNKDSDSIGTRSTQESQPQKNIQNRGASPQHHIEEEEEEPEIDLTIDLPSQIDFGDDQEEANSKNRTVPLAGANNNMDRIKKKRSGDAKFANGKKFQNLGSLINNSRTAQEKQSNNNNTPMDRTESTAYSDTDLPQTKEELAAFVLKVVHDTQARSVALTDLTNDPPGRAKGDEEEGKVLVMPLTTGRRDNDDSPFGDLDPALPTTTKEEKEIEMMALLAAGKRKAEDDKSGSDWHAPFSESTYTLMYMCRLQSYAFWYGIFVYALQMTTISLTLVDIVDVGADNPLRIPPMVDLTVTCAQAISLFVALAYQSDLIEAVKKLQDGFYPEVLEFHPGATYFTWIVSSWAQLIAGLLLLTDSFILTMQMSTVIEGMLNLTALLFMAEIDDIAFAMAKMGFVKSQLQAEAEAVSDFKVPKRKRSHNRARRVLYLFTLAGLYMGYGILKHRQLNGHYLVTYIYVQFGDAYNSKIPYYSGILKSGNERTAGYRQYHDLGTENIVLGYCSQEKAWAFSDKGDSCDFFAKSSETKTYDVTTIPDSEWHVKDLLSRLQPFETFSLVGRDCNADTCQGNCTGGQCECPHDHFGMDCEFKDICPELSLDLRTSAFPASFPDLTRDGGDDDDDDWGIIFTEKYAVSDEFEILKDSRTKQYARAYNMPVFYSNKTYPANIIFFGGRRWILTSEWDLINLTKAQLENPGRRFFPEKTIATLDHGFHAYHQANYTTFFLSDPVDFETPSFLPTPAGLGWWSVGIVNSTARHYTPDTKVSTVLNCKSCDNGGFCGVGGTCNQTTSKCDCQWGYKGDKCELQQACYEQDLPCWDDGVCDDTTGVCRCNVPWYGQLCELKYKCYEEYGSCRNGGTCDMEYGDCTCSEDPAVSGNICELQKDCQIFGCSNGGMCGPGGACACRPPFYGVLCDLVDRSQQDLLCSDDQDCVNGACDATTGLCLCDDPASIGSLCQDKYDCTSSFSHYVCGNGGSCNYSTGLCDCLDGYFGPDCSQIAPCVNNADCGGTDGDLPVFDGVDLPGVGDDDDDDDDDDLSTSFLPSPDTNTCDLDSGQCWCSVGFGPRCQHSWSCAENGCNNRGLCNKWDVCKCEAPYYGQNCDQVVQTDELMEMTQDFIDTVERCGFPPYPEPIAELGEEQSFYCPF